MDAGAEWTRPWAVVLWRKRPGPVGPVENIHRRIRLANALLPPSPRGEGGRGVRCAFASITSAAEAKACRFQGDGAVVEADLDAGAKFGVFRELRLLW